MFWRAYGINELVINETREVNGQPQTISKEENSWTYTLARFLLSLFAQGTSSHSHQVASSINIGLKILESPQGREALEDLGRHVVQNWHDLGVHQFGGNVNHMRAYVDHFLSALRQSFPNTFVADIGGPDVLAHAQRMPPSPVPGLSWDGRTFCHTSRRRQLDYISTCLLVSSPRTGVDGHLPLPSRELPTWLAQLQSSGCIVRETTGGPAESARGCSTGTKISNSCLASRLPTSSAMPL